MKALFFAIVLTAGVGVIAHPASAKVPKPGRKPIPQFCNAGEIIGNGEASWYGEDFDGQKSASGKKFDMTELTAAHRTLPFGTRVQVKNRHNGKTLVVKITDRGPYIDGRVIDVSKAAARKLGFMGRGVAPVEIRKCLKPGEKPAPPPKPAKTVRKRSPKMILND